MSLLVAPNRNMAHTPVISEQI